MEFKEEFNHLAAFRTMRALCERYSSRVSGSAQELEAMRYIIQQFRKKVGYYPVVDQYPVKFYKGQYASIQILPGGEIIEGKPMWMTLNSPSNGVVAEIKQLLLEGEGTNYIENITGKIVVIRPSEDYLSPDIFIQIKNIYKQNPSGVVILSNYHPEVIRSDVFFRNYSIFSEIPTTIISEAQFPLEDLEGKKGKLVIFGEIDVGNMFNVSVIIPGSKKEYILIYAHHDTVENTQGARNNAAGVAILLELAKILSRYNLNYSYRFISLGGKEIGLEGMKKLLEDYDPSKVILGINIDGVDSTPGKILSIVTGDEQLFELIESTEHSIPIPTETIRNSPIDGDNMVLADKNIPSLRVMFKGEQERNINHTELDTIDDYDPESLKKMGEYLMKIISVLEQMEKRVFSKKVPEDFKKSAEKYFNNLLLYQE